MERGDLIIVEQFRSHLSLIYYQIEENTITILSALLSMENCFERGKPACKLRLLDEMHLKQLIYTLNDLWVD